MAVAETSLRRVVDELASIPPVEGALVLTRKGRLLACRLREGLDAKSLARECKTILDAACGAVATSPDDLVRVDLRAARGSTVVVRAGDDAILAVLTKTRTPESLSLEISRAVEAVRAAVG